MNSDQSNRALMSIILLQERSALERRHSRLEKYSDFCRWAATCPLSQLSSVALTDFYYMVDATQMIYLYCTNHVNIRVESLKQMC